MLEATRKMAENILANAPLAVEYAKMVIDEGYDMPLKNALTLEEYTFGLLFSTEDQKEGMNAFLEKRRPDFKRK